MRTRLSRSAGLIAATGLGLAVSPLALATAAGATAPTPTPTPTVSASPTSSPSPSPSSSPSPTKPQVEPLQQGNVDARVKIVHKVTGGKRKAAIATFVVKSTKPATGYRLTITMHKDLDWHAPNFNGWDCTGSADTITCDFPGEATTRPGDVGLVFEMPQTAGLKLDLSASIRTNEADSNPANNKDTRTIVVPADEPTARTGTLTGRIWNDANHNGRQDKGEKGVAGAKVLATFGPGDTTTNAYGPVTTGADGRYKIDNITPNVPGLSGFTFAVAAPGKAWSFTKYKVGAANGNSDFHFIDNDDMPGAPYDEYFGKDSVIGLADEHTITAGKTLVLDAGLVKRDSGAGDDDTLPKTGAAIGGFVGAGALLIGGGIALTVLARRRRSTVA